MTISVDYQNSLDDAVDSTSGSSLSSGTTYTFDGSTGGQVTYTKSTPTYSATTGVHSFDIHSGYGASPSYYAHVRYSPGNLEIHLDDQYFMSQCKSTFRQ